MEVPLRVLLRPEHRRSRLRRRAARRLPRAHFAYLGDRFKINAASQPRRRWQRRRLVGRESERLIAPDLAVPEERRGGPPNARLAAGREVVQGNAPIGGAASAGGGGDRAPELDAGPLAGSIGNGVERGRKQRIDLRAVVRTRPGRENRMGCSRDRGLGIRIPGRLDRR